MDVKINHVCKKCLSENLQNNLMTIEIDEDFFSGKEVTCQNEHNTFVISETPRFPYLIQNGVEAFNSGFYIEAFHAVYSGFEAYKKEFTAAYFFKEFNDINKTEDVMKKLDRSERLEGAFLVGFTNLSGGEIPLSLTRSSVELRNNVVHKGMIPNSRDCEKIGNSIFKIIATSNRLLNDRQDSGQDMFPLLLIYEFELARYLLKKKGYEHYFETPEDFYNGKSDTISFAINELSPNTVLKHSDIHDSMFTNYTKQKSFLLRSELYLSHN